MALPTKTTSRKIGSVLIQIDCVPCEGEYLDATVKINGNLLCWISWTTIDPFIKDIDEVIEKHRI